MSKSMLDIYTDYLICSFGQASATGLARLLSNEISHDAVTRFLSAEPKTSAALWHVVKPRRDQPYQTMQLMQWNYFLEHGLLSFDHETKQLRINYDKYRDVVRDLLERVLRVQFEGDKGSADRFIDEYAKWDESPHGAVAASIRERQRYRFRLFKYAALGE